MRSKCTCISVLNQSRKSKKCVQVSVTWNMFFAFSVERDLCSWWCAMGHEISYATRLFSMNLIMQPELLFYSLSSHFSLDDSNGSTTEKRTTIRHSRSSQRHPSTVTHKTRTNGHLQRVPSTKKKQEQPIEGKRSQSRGDGGRRR